MSMLNFLATVFLLSKRSATQPQVASPLKVWAEARIAVTKVPRLAAPVAKDSDQYVSPPASAPSARPKTFL